ncbi:MAG TPA: hypothetical protein VGR74_03915, partial [Actinomycetota bacterium]|nr:hypothetical protein [Actinomycetota bacterium]
RVSAASRPARSAAASASSSPARSAQPRRPAGLPATPGRRRLEDRRHRHPVRRQRLTLRATPPTTGRLTYRVYKSADRDHAASTSARQTVTVS